MLQSSFLEKNRTWPRDQFDFDKIWPTSALRLRSDDFSGSVFSSSLVVNFIAALFVVVFGAGLVGLWVDRADFAETMAQEPWIVRAVCWVALGGSILGWLVCVGLCLLRGRLVIDLDRREVAVYAFWRRVDTVSLTEMRVLSFQRVWRASSDSDGVESRVVRTVPALVMELNDGTLIRVSAGDGVDSQLLMDRLEAACEGQAVTASKPA